VTEPDRHTKYIVQITGIAKVHDYKFGPLGDHHKESFFDERVVVSGAPNQDAEDRVGIRLGAGSAALLWTMTFYHLTQGKIQVKAVLTFREWDGENAEYHKVDHFLVTPGETKNGEMTLRESENYGVVSFSVQHLGAS
jgi:hypothetical protein